MLWWGNLPEAQGVDRARQSLGNSEVAPMILGRECEKPEELRAVIEQIRADLSEIEDRQILRGGIPLFEMLVQRPIQKPDAPRHRRAIAFGHRCDCLDDAGILLALSGQFPPYCGEGPAQFAFWHVARSNFYQFDLAAL